MFHKVDTVFNSKTSKVLPGARVQVYSTSGVIQPLYADDAGTPISTVSGEANTAITNDDGLYDFWVADGTYDIRFFVGVTPYLTLKSILMSSPGIGPAYVGKYVFNVKNNGVVGGNTGNQATAINNTIALAEAAAASGGGADVVFPADVYRTTGEIQVKQSRINLVGEGNAEIRPVGSFDTVRFESNSAQTYLYRNNMAGIILSEGGKTGGGTVVGRYVAQIFLDVKSFAGWNGIELESFNTATITGRIESPRGGSGSRFIRLVGGRSLGGGQYNARSDVAIINDITLGGVKSAGMIGVLIDGFVHTVSAKSLYAINIGGDAILTENFVSALDIPTFLRFNDFQADNPTGAGVRLNFGTDIAFSVPHLNRSNTSDGMIVSQNITDYAVTGGFATGNFRRGFTSSGTGGNFQGFQVYNNSNPAMGATIGTNPGFVLGGASRDTVMSGCRSGRRGTSTYQSYGGQIDVGADGYSITGNDFQNNVTPGVNNGTTPGATRILANNLG